MNAVGDPTELPPWVHLLGVPTWVSGPQRNLCFLNHDAELLLGVAAGESLGKPCFQIVAGRDAAGGEFCRARCSVMVRAKNGLPIKPATICIDHKNSSWHWLRILSIPLWSEDGKQLSLVDCALDVDRAKAMEDYFSRVLARTPGDLVKANRRRSPHLTPREQEILEELALDHDAASIAANRHLSYPTVRNHVQHILNKLDVHSIVEAIAWYLVGQDGYESAETDES